MSEPILWLKLETFFIPKLAKLEPSLYVYNLLYICQLSQAAVYLS